MGDYLFLCGPLIGIYENGEQGFRMITPVFQQEVLMLFWPLIIFLIVAEVVLSVYKWIQKQWTFPLATLCTIKEVAAVVIFVFILMQGNLFTTEFLHQLSEVFQTTTIILESRIVWGGIAVTVLFTGISIFDMYRKANISIQTK